MVKRAADKRKPNSWGAKKGLNFQAPKVFLEEGGVK